MQYQGNNVLCNSYCKTSQPTSTLSTAAELVIGCQSPAYISFHQQAISVYFCVIFLFDFHRHITFHVDESELSLPSGALQADPVMRAAVCKPIV